MTCKFNGQSLVEENNTFTSITTDNVGFIEAGLSTFSCDDIYQKFYRMEEKNSTVKIFSERVGTTNYLQEQRKYLRRSAWYTINPVLQKPTFMMFDIAARQYVEAEISVLDPIFGGMLLDVMGSGLKNPFAGRDIRSQDHNPPMPWTALRAASLIAEEYNLGYLEVAASDPAPIAQVKNLKKRFINSIQTSLSGCASWSEGYDFVFDGDGDAPCTVKEAANFEIRFFDTRSPRKEKRSLVGSGPPKFNFTPRHPWGTAYAGNKPFTGDPGFYPALDPGGSDNPKNNVTAELDVYYNPNTGKAEAGTRQVLAKMITECVGVKINPLSPNVDELSHDAMQDAHVYMGHFASGYAMPMSVHQGNPYMFGPTFSNKGTGCEDDKKEKLLVTNRTQKSFPVGRVVMLQRIDDEWIPMDFGDDDVQSFSSVGKWNFQYLIADGDSYFKDDRHYFEEQVQPELAGSITPSQYESLFRFNFYDTIVDAIGTVNNSAGIDAANHPFKSTGQVTLENSTSTATVPSGTPNSSCGNVGSSGNTTTSAGPIASRIEANNGIYVRTLESSEPVPGCFSPSSGCGQALEDLRANIPQGGGPFSADFEAAMEAFQAAIGETTPVPPWHPHYDGQLTLGSPPANSNHSVKLWEQVYRNGLSTETIEAQKTNDDGNGYWYRLFNTTPEAGPDWKPKNNWFYCVMGCQRKEMIQGIVPNAAGGTSFVQRRLCTKFGPISSYEQSFAKALLAQLDGICGAERNDFPQVKTYVWKKSELSKKFVGSRRYLNVTSFDMMSHRWNGKNYRDFLSLSNPSYDMNGALVENPSDQSFHQFQPFWGALFTEGYTEDSVTKLITRRSSTSTVGHMCCNAATHAFSDHFGTMYLNSHGGKGPNGFSAADDPADYSYALKVAGAPTSIDKIYGNGDINLVHLPADIGTNASPDGKYGSPINDFQRMISLVNVVNPGRKNTLGVYEAFDPKRSEEPYVAASGSITVDWGNGKSAEPNPLAINVRTYFAKKYYDINGEQFGIQDRQCWVYEKPVRLAAAATTDKNANSTAGDHVSQYAMDSHYDLQPVSPKLTFVPLSAEWVGAFDSHDRIYSMIENRRAYSGTYNENWHQVAFEHLSVPQNNSNPPDWSELQGAGWYWGDKDGKNSQINNTTISRLSLYPLEQKYDHTNTITGGSYAVWQQDPTVYPAGPDYVEQINTYGGDRGNKIFRIGRNHEFIMTPAIDTASFMDPNAPPATGPSDFDIDFMEPENEGTAQVDTYVGLTIFPTEPNHGLVGANANETVDNGSGNFTPSPNANHVVKLEPGFPFDGYVRHRTTFTDDGIIGPRQCWHENTADCIGIITARANVSTSQANLVCTTINTRGLNTYKPQIVGEEYGSWGAPGQNISSLGGEHLFARVFESWPDDQTLFDARYFAVMHFNPGDLLSEPLIDDEFEQDGLEYTRELISQEVDYRVPTLVGAGTDTRNWPELLKGETVYGNNVTSAGLIADYDMWKVSTIRRGMLLPFTYTLPTIGLSDQDILFLNDLNGNPQRGTGFKVGDTLTFQGGTGTDAKIKVTEVGSNGEIDLFEVIDNGRDFLPSDFPKSTWVNNQNAATFSSPLVVAVPDVGVEGKDVYITAKSGTVVYKDMTDAAPRTSQNSPARVSLPVPTDENDAIGREENKVNTVSLPLIAADGTFRSYDVFLHYHNDITSVVSYNQYDTVNAGTLKDNNKVQFMRLELSTR